MLKAALKAANSYMVRSGVSLGAFRAFISASSSLVPAKQAKQIQWKWGLLTLDAKALGAFFQQPATSEMTAEKAQVVS